MEASTCIPVTHVTKTSPFINTDLPLTISILPQNATNQILSWNIVDDGGTGATIENNVLSATDTGTAIIEVRIENALCDGVTRMHAYPITLLEEIREPDDVPSTMKPPVFCLAPGTSIMSAAIFRTETQMISAFPIDAWHHVIGLNLVLKDIANDFTYRLQGSWPNDFESDGNGTSTVVDVGRVDAEIIGPRPFVNIVVHARHGSVGGSNSELVLLVRPVGYSNLSLLEQNDQIRFTTSGISTDSSGIRNEITTTQFPFFNFNNTCEGTIPQ